MDNLEMSIFDSSNLELNFDADPTEMFGAAKPQEGDNPPATEDTNEPPTGDDNNPNEGNGLEDVVGDEGDNEGSDDVNTSPNLFSSFASELHNQGVLPSLDLEKNKIEGTEDLVNVIKAQIDTQTKQYLISKLGEEGYDALEKGVSLAQYQQHSQNVNSLESITDNVIEGDLDLAKKIILEDYINQGLSEDRAKRVLQKTIDLGEDAIIEDAKDSIKSLKVFEQNRLEQQKLANIEHQKQLAQQQEKIDNDLKHSIYNNKEIIEGVPLNKVIQDRVYESITKVVSQSPEGIMENQLMKDRRENPIEFDTKLYYLYELTNGFKDFSKIKTKAATSAVSDFEKALRQAKFESGGSPTYMQDGDSYEGFGSELVF